MKISSKFFEVYDAIKEKFGGLIKEQYVAKGEKWLRINLNFMKCGAILIYFAETKDGKIKIGFNHEIVKFLPRYIEVKDTYIKSNDTYGASFYNLDIDNTEDFFIQLYGAIVTRNNQK